MQTKLSSFGFLMGAILFVSINLSPKKLTGQQAHLTVISTSGEAFYKSQCAFCHTSEELMAPDMKKIKAVYLKKFKTKEAFIKAVITFVKNPNKKNAIYKDGIDNFSDMPKMPFKDEQIKAVAEYIYSAKL